jgi:hypothetical protein
MLFTPDINLMLSTFKRKEKRREEKGTLLRSSLFWDVTRKMGSQLHMFQDKLAIS